MKHFKHVVLLACLLLALPLQGEPVGPQRALETAQAFFRHDRNQAMRLAPLERLQLASAPLTKAGESDPAYYVYNRRGGGFVLIAGDDACVPVLGYSFTGSFRVGDDMPDGLRAWLEELEEQVTVVRGRNLEADRLEARPSWEALKIETKAGGSQWLPAKQLETPRWGQGEPFNNLAPVIDGKRTLAGCVPLAMSMLCRFFGYPAAGSGTLPEYSYESDNGSTQTVQGFSLGHSYDWAHMKMYYKDGYTEEEADAVSRLVYDCGVMVQAKFDVSATSANTTRMAGCAVNFLGFNPGAIYYKREFFTDDEWLDMLKAELQDHPVLYSARREDSGHTFLVDGYDKQGYLSVNWGWNGSSNGYFALSAFTPTESRAYIYNHGAVFGLTPDISGGSVVDPMEYLYYQSGTGSSGTVYNGLTANGKIVTGESFKLVAGFLYNGGIRPFVGKYRIVLKDKDGNIKEYVSPAYDLNELNSGSGRGYSSVECLMKSYPLEGDRLSLLYRSNNWPEGVWESPLYDHTSTIETEILVTDETTLAEVTGLDYNKSNGEVTIQTKDLVDVTLADASGTKYPDCISIDMTEVKIQTANLSKGTYTLALKRFGDNVTLTLKMGKK